MANSDSLHQQSVNPGKPLEYYGNFLEKSQSIAPEAKQNAHDFGLYFIKLFLIDLSDRIKELRRHKRTRKSKQIVEFLVQLSTEVNPIEPLSSFEISELKDFQMFLEGMLNNLETDINSDHLTHAYQVLTENLESTAEYLNTSFQSIEKNPEQFNQISSFLSKRSPEPSTDVQIPDLESGDLLFDTTQEPGSKQKVYSKHALSQEGFPGSTLEFGFELSTLFSNGESSIHNAGLVLDEPRATLHTPSEQASAETTEVKAEDKTNAQRLLADIALSAKSEEKDNIIVRFFETLSASPDYMNDLGYFYTIPDFPDFLDFMNMIEGQENTEIEETEKEILISHVLSIMDNALHEADLIQKLEDYIHADVLTDLSQIEPDDIETSLPELTDLLENDDDIQPMTTEALEEFTSELEESATVSKESLKPQKKHSESNDISFSNYAKGILKKIGDELPDTESGHLASTAISNLVHRSEIIDALIVTGLPGLSDFGQFIQTSLINNTKLDDITNFSNDIILEIRDKLLAHFDEGGQLTPDVLETESEFEKDVRKQAAEETEKNILDYESYVFTILDQIKIQLQDKPKLVSYLDDMCQQPHILEALLKSELVSLKNFARFTHDAMNSEVPVDELSSKSEQIITELVQELQVSDDTLHTPEAEEFDKAMESLEDHLEEPHQAELPSLTDFSLDDDDISFDPLAQDAEPNASEEGSTEQIDENIALAFVTSVLEQLMDFAENRPKAKAYLKSILEAPDILKQLENSSFDGFKEFSGFITHALSSGSLVSELEQSKAEILTVLQNELGSDTELSEISETENTSEESIDLSVSPDQDQANETEQEITTQALPNASIDETLSLNDLFLEHAEPEPSEQAPITEEPGQVLSENEIPEITLEDSFHSDALEQGSLDELSQGIIAGDMPGEEDLIKPTDDPEPAQDIHEPEASADQAGSENMLEGLEIPDEFIVAEEQNDSEASVNAPDNESDFIDFLNVDNADQPLDDSDTLMEPESETLSAEEPSDTKDTRETSPENINEDFFNEDMTLLSDHDYFENMPQNLETTPQEPETPEDISDNEQGKDTENSVLAASDELVESDDPGLDQDLELPEPQDLEDSQSPLEPADLTEPGENEETQSEEPTVENSTENNELIETETGSDEDELLNFDTDLILDDTQSMTDEQPSNDSDNFSFEDSLENFDQHDELDLSLSDTIYNPEDGGSSESTSQDTEETLKIPQDSLSEEDQLQEDTFSNEQAQESTQIKETDNLNTSEQDLNLLDDSDQDSFSESLENLSLEDETTDTLDDSEHENITQTQTDQLPELDNDILNDNNLILDEGFELEETPIENSESTQSDKPSFEPDDIQQVFLEEAHEYIEKLNADLLALDKQADTLQPELVNQVLRGSHTIKGSAAMVQLTNISELAHKMEDSLQVVRDKDLPIPRVLIDVLFQSADAILSMLQNFRQTGSDKSGDHSQLIETLVFYSEQLQSEGRITQIDVPSNEADSQEQTDFEPNEIQQVFLEEAKEYVEKLNADLLELDKNANTPQPELVNQVLRGSHTIKGSAAMVQLSQLSDLAHKMEDSLQIVRDKNLKVPSLLIDILFKSVDAISEMLQNFRRTGKDHYETQKLLVETLKFYQKQLEEKGDITEAYTAQVETAKAEEPAKGQKPVQPSVAEQTVRIDIAALNNLVNLSAELVIARNRLNNELGAVEKLATKFLKERQSLSQISKKIGESVKKTPRKKDNQEEANEAENTEKAIIESQELEERSDVLEEFSEGEFDRFSEFDIISRDIKSSMLNFEDSIKELRDFSSFLNQNIVKVSTIANDLNRVIVDMRMVPVKQMFIRFSRSVRDIAKSQNKKINFTTEGEDTKLDKMVMEEVIEPMMHIVRNSIGHGIESPENRLESGKPEEGQVSLKAYQKGNRVILEVDDDGAGISVEKVKKKALEKHLITKEEAEQMTPEEATSIIFKPGFSTAEKVTSLHGRGVGLDVVHNTIRKLKGFVNIDSKEGVGTKFIISLPLTLAISDALLVEAEGYTYAIPLDMVFETVNFPSEYIEHEDDKRFIEIRGDRFELVYLNDLLGYESDVLHFKATLPVAVIELEDKKVAVGVEKLFGKEEIVVKALGSHLRNVRGVIGATIRGDGQVILILDMNFLLSPEEQKGKDLYVTIEKSETEEIDESAPKLPERTKRKRKSEKICVLAADDSPSVRKYIQSVLHQHDIDVISVDDGLNALNKLPTSNCDIIVTDLEMPRMNGFELVSEVRKMPQYNEVPIVIVTARAGDKHRRKGIELGANAFINKPFDPTQLVETIESFVS